MTLFFLGHHMPLDGYGYATINIARELQRLAPDTRIVDMCGDDGGFAQDGDQWAFEDGAAVVALCTPDWLPAIHADRLIAYTMFETTRPPDKWPGLINAHAALCLTPSEWCRQMFIENGVTVPIEVVRWGVNPQDYWPVTREREPGAPSHPKTGTPARGLCVPYRFYWSGTPDQRKGWDVAYAAFTQAFGKSRDVELHLHFRDALPGAPRFGDRNVRVTIGKFDRPVLRALLQEADCFVYPTRGEGWGSPPREAAATGLPVIATDYGGTSEEIMFWAMALGVTDRMTPAGYGWYGFRSQTPIGEWPEPDVDQLVALMVWCATHPAEAAQMGRNAAAWLAREATWERTARGILQAVSQKEVA